MTSLIEEMMDEYLALKEAAGRSSKTLRWYTYHLSYFHTWCEEHQITTPAQVVTAQKLLQAFNECHLTNPTSRHGYMQVVRGFLNWCALDASLGIRELVLRSLKIPKGQEEDVPILSKDHIKKLYKACEKSPNPIRDECMVKMLLDTGVRLKELVYDSSTNEKSGVKLEDVYLKTRKWNAASSYIVVHGKGRRDRSINIGAATEAAVRRYLRTERGRPEHDFLFASRLGPLSARMVEHRIKELGEQAGIPNLHPHLFRHTFAVNALLSGVPELILMQILGHSSLAATRIYVRAAQNRGAKDKVPSLVDQSYSKALP